jgi:hypothetical protein
LAFQNFLGIAKLVLASRHLLIILVRIILIAIIDQASIILPLLTRFGITSANLGYFVLDNTLNNNTTLVKLSKKLDFDPAEKRLHCIGHILNLIAEEYLFGQDCSTFKDKYKKAGALERRAL